MEVVIQSNCTYTNKIPHRSQAKSYQHRFHTPTVSDSTFAERMAYALLLHYWREGAELTQSAIAKAVGMTQPGVQPWYERTDPPKDWTVHKPLAAVLGVPEGWLIKNDGDPPRPELWAPWFKERRARTRLGRGAAKVSTAASAGAGRGRRSA